MKHSRGFTLIELLVVISIIVILATLAATSYRSANKRARDARRAADIEQVRSALELYRTENNVYPPAEGDCAGGFAPEPTQGGFNGMLVKLDEYMSGSVADPLYDPDDPDAGYGYVYSCGKEGGAYRIGYTPETGDEAGTLIEIRNP